MDIIRVTKAKKLIFIRSIACMYDFIPIRRIFIERLAEFDPENQNPYDSPILEMLKISVEMELLDHVQNMFVGTPVSKLSWKK